MVSTSEAGARRPPAGIRGMLVRSLRWRGLAVAAWIFLATLGVLGQHRLTVTFTERAGAARNGEYAVAGVPLPRDWNVTDPGRLRLTFPGGSPVPAQFEVLTRWGAAPDAAGAPIQWLLAGALVNLPDGGRLSLILDDQGPGPSPPAIDIDAATPGLLRVDTGAALFELDTGGGLTLFRQVTVAGQPLLDPPAPRDAIRYDPAGGDSMVPGGNPDFTPRAMTATVERAGPLAAVIRLAGSIPDEAGRAILDATLRYHFTAGRADVRVDVTVENNQPVLTGEWDQPLNVHDQGAVNSVHVGGLAVGLRPRPGTGPLTVRLEEGVSGTAPAQPVILHQDSSGTDFWDAYVGLVGWPGQEAAAAPRLQSFCVHEGFRITGAGPEVSGRRALGWLTAGYGAAAPNVAVAVRGFTENFPKQLRVDPDGLVQVDLFPEGERFRHNLRVGEEKTHSLLFAFAAGEMSAEEAERRARAFQQPILGRLVPADYCRSSALGEVPPADVARWPLYERYTRIAFEPNPDFDPAVHDPNFGNSTLRDAIERYNFFGWQDYGDVPLDYEAFGPHQAGQMNLKYWFLNGMLVQSCRSGLDDWLDLALPAAWHMADIDYLHIPDEGIGHWSHGAYFGHSQHDEPGNVNPNRNSNSPSVDLFFGVPDLLLAWRLTGERRFLDVAGEGLAAMQNLSQFSDFDAPVLERERANLVFAYIEGYRQTGDARWRDELRNIVGRTADLAGKGWLADPAAYGAAHPGAYQRMFMFAQVVWAMGRYLDLAAEYGWPDDLGVVPFLTAGADFVIQHAMVEYRPGRAAVPYDVVFDGSDPSYLDINNWALTMADALAYAWKYSGHAPYLDAAGMFYATGTIDPVWEDDPPVYLGSKDLVNTCNWGLVYMNQLAALPLGDLNADGRLTAADLLLHDLLRAGLLAAGTSPFTAPRAAADLDHDGLLTTADRQRLASRLIQ
ncbi:MAG: hypothetical protein JXQ27_14210 [Acidobacteria bacterium]|nr:hypothetical protein [Acidobacteriota bacterium]